MTPKPTIDLGSILVILGLYWGYIEIILGLYWGYSGLGSMLMVQRLLIGLIRGEHI